MADEPQVIRGINWRETFPFTHIFRAFRVAIHPSKLVLALLALLLIYGGGCVLDAVWPNVLPETVTLHQNDTIIAKGVGPFRAFLCQEADLLNNVAKGVENGQWLGGGGVVDSICAFLITEPGQRLAWSSGNPIFFAVLFVWMLVVWSVFGGAIARIAAVHVARDEKLSIRQALKFSLNKFLSFLFAPIIPLAIVLFVGAAVAVGGLLLYVPWIGPVVVSLLFFLALAAGLVMTLLLLGTGGGFNLMYPTVAVEGSDSFDAISRSFSYVYARPWRMLFYTAVAVAYGSLCYIFVRLFLFLVLWLSHYFVSWWVVGTHQTAWNTMWPGPDNLWQLPYSPDWEKLHDLHGGATIGAGILSVWIYLTIGLLGAFAISFYFSANTIIYYLMRQEVDATELDDVYLEAADEDFVEPAPVPPATPGTPTAPMENNPTAAAAPAVLETPAAAPAGDPAAQKPTA